ncbi:MAG: M23 family metallopeptidase [Reyranella sp.]|nr:M23 family metallopeptidase [Reyranella sp.]
MLPSTRNIGMIQVDITKPAPGVSSRGSRFPRRVARALVLHDGVDLVASHGTPVYAASDGVVLGARRNGGYGNWVQIDHSEDDDRGKLSTVYGHLSRFAPGLKAGVRVSQGDVIGFVGSTGRSTGAHLHFEILSNGKPVDPMSHPQVARAQLLGADLERFNKQVAGELAGRDRDVVIVPSSFGF